MKASEAIDCSIPTMQKDVLFSQKPVASKTSIKVFMLIKFTKSYNLLKATTFMLAAVAKSMYVGPAIHDASA
jgi:hypothetical protein